MARRPVIFGNWKMHGTNTAGVTLATEVAAALPDLPDVEVGIAPPFTALAEVRRQLGDGSKLHVAGQNCHYEAQGAYTGEISPAMLADLGCSHVILGHSERRQYFCEDDALINRKLLAALNQPLTPILCIGETLEQREAGQTFAILGTQLASALAAVKREQALGIIIAYEPVWAIGTGKTATPEQAAEAHAFVRNELRTLYDDIAAERIRIQYGGSVKPANAKELLTSPDIDGALVGGASLKAADFIAILRCAS